MRSALQGKDLQTNVFCPLSRSFFVGPGVFQLCSCAVRRNAVNQFVTFPIVGLFDCIGPLVLAGRHQATQQKNRKQNLYALHMQNDVRDRAQK